MSREPGAMFERADPRRQKQHGILLASGGLLLALAVLLALRVLGLIRLDYGHWAVAVAITVAAQSVLWLLPYFGVERHLRWDRHYLYLPMLTAAVLLDFYAYLAVEVRWLALSIWFVALLFVAGRAGFVDVLVLSTAMAAGYTGAMALRVARGDTLVLSLEAVLAAAFLVICLYAAVVYERLRRERREMSAVRRRLAELALTDPLTGLPNRRRFEEILRSELDRVRRYGGSCALAMIDVDYFKNYNDMLGHVAGDTILKELGALMREQLRSSDVLARYGGEEFGLIMVNTASEEAYRIIERLRRAVAQHPFRGAHVQPGKCLTISAGVATSRSDADPYEDLVQRADSALYVAKRQGRNRVQTAALG